MAPQRSIIIACVQNSVFLVTNLMIANNIICCLSIVNRTTCHVRSSCEEIMY